MRSPVVGRETVSSFMLILVLALLLELPVWASPASRIPLRNPAKHSFGRSCSVDRVCRRIARYVDGFISCRGLSPCSVAMPNI